MKAEAKDCYQAIIDHDDGNLEARLHLARLYEELGMPERAGAYVHDVLSATSQDLKRPGKMGTYKQTGPSSAPRSSSSISTMLTPCLPRQVTRPRALEKEMREQAHTENALMQYLRVQELTEEARNGNLDIKVQWKAAVKTLIQDFRSNRSFYPYDKNMNFFGYSKQARIGSLKSKGGRPIQEVQTFAGRLPLSSSTAAKEE